MTMDMLAKYSQYNEFIPAIEIFYSGLNDFHCRYYASDLLESYLQSGEINIEGSIRRTIAIMKLTGLPVQDHFRRIYRSEKGNVTGDWKLSELACSMIILSFDESIPEAREMQQYLLSFLDV